MAELTGPREDVRLPGSAAAPDDLSAGRDRAQDSTTGFRRLDRLATLEQASLPDVLARAAPRLALPPLVPESARPGARGIAAAEGDGFGELLRSRRQRSGLTQAQLAELSGLGVRTIRNWEQGCILHPHRDSVRRLAEGLGLTGEARASFERIAAGAHPLPSTVVPEPPRQLPHDLADFTGRFEQTARLRAFLCPREGTAARVVVISGPPGVGKTALAVRVSHQLQEHFPDGQLFVDLRGPLGAPLEPWTVLAALLRAVGVAAAAIPAELHERVALYRTRLAERRILLVLDAAVDEAQIRPLLPGGRGGAALVTSRSRLAGIEGVSAVPLGVLEAGEAMELLARVASPRRVAAEPEAAAAVIGMCGRLPLAVRIIGARLAARPHLQLGRMAERLADEQRRLDLLDIGDLAVRASFELSYRRLEPEAGRAIRLMAQLEVPDLSAWAIAALLGTSAERGEELAERLVDVHLPELTAQGRYRMHDLLRLFARERLEQEEPEEARAAALDRLLARSLRRLRHLNRLFGPDCWEPGPATVEDQPMGGDAPFASRQEAAAWLTAERPTIVNAAVQASGHADPARSWQVAGALFQFSEIRTAPIPDWRVLIEAMLGSARRVGERDAEIRCLVELGIVAGAEGDHEGAVTGLQQALAMSRVGENRLLEARCHCCLGRELSALARYREAIACHQQALALARRAGGRRGVAGALCDLGSNYCLLGDQQHALACLDEGLARTRELGDQYLEGRILACLGEVRWRQERFEEAIATFLESLSIRRELADRYGQAEIHGRLGDAYRKRGQPVIAVSHYRAALTTYEELKDGTAAEAINARLSQP